MTTAAVRLWGSRIGAVTWDPERELGYFEYEPEFEHSGVEVAPLTMPFAPRVFAFPALARSTYHGLPGMLADVLPDRFGNALIDAWLASQGRSAESFNPVERLCYTGQRGMGALEFEPALRLRGESSKRLDLEHLVGLANQALADRAGFVTSLAEEDAARDSHGVASILRVGTSAGGARAKAVIAWNPESGEVRSGQVSADSGFSYWLLKFDGITENRDKELRDAQGFGRIEYAYSLMAHRAGIEMAECRLLEEHGRAHFVTKRFDRDAKDGGKLHMQSLCALRHLDFNMAGAHSYEQAFDCLRSLGLPKASAEEQFRRMAFNVLARNQDDHTKNIAFLMNKAGDWSLSPAFDLTYAFNPTGDWTSRHQMTIQGKRDGFTRADFTAVGKLIALKRGRAESLLDEVGAAVAAWREFAEVACVDESTAEAIAATHRVTELTPSC